MLDDVTGHSVKLHHGVPQGAVLSPLLFLFYIDGIRKTAPLDTCVSMYADDIAVWSQHKDKLRAQLAVQKAVDSFGLWSADHKFSLNPAKCEVAFFSTDPAEAKWSSSIALNGHTFSFNRTPTFLGVTLDRTLTFRPQTEAVKARALGRVRIMSALASKEWGWSRRSLRAIYTATVHSVLHYCEAAWQPWLAKYNLQILERAKNRALRAMTGQMSDTPLECLRLEAGITSFATTVCKNCITAWEKSTRLPSSNPRRNLFDSPVSHRWKNRKGFSVMGKEEEVKLGLDQVSREMFVKWHPPHWSWNANPSWTVRISLSGGSSKRHSDKELLIDAINTITEVGTYEYAIYTDGSAERGFRNGGSAAIATTGPASEPTIVHSSSRKGNSLTSSLETEVMALLLATEWLADQGEGGLTVICSDDPRKK